MSSAPIFEWPMVDSFLDRQRELARLEAWWLSADPMPVNLYGRRRSGKSWLFRRLAHGKPAVVLVARMVTPGAQFEAFAERLEPFLGVKPALPDLASLFRVLFRAARDEKLLVVIDEFPWLLPTTESAIERELSSLQAVFEEERDASKMKLILCGSVVAQMESLQRERNPLHGRFIPLQLQPMRFAEGALFMPELDPVAQFERFAVSGGMPRYLAAIAHGKTLKGAACQQVLDRSAPLWDEARTVLEQELREPKVYFSILEALATGDKELNEVVSETRSSPATISKYLSVLEDMRIVSRRLPIGAGRSSRSGHWHLRDAFFRFWFRFVFPYQDDLESGLRPADLFDTEVAPQLADHIAPEFEDWCREWTRIQFGQHVSSLGPWWGAARHDLRRTGDRHTEEIDIVGIGRNRVTVVGEARWRNRPLDRDILRDIDEFKIPALAQAGFRLTNTPHVLLFSKAGYTKGLIEEAGTNDHLTLVDVSRALSEPNGH